MLERPDLADATVAGYVRQGWGLTGASVRFVPVGYDAQAWAYDVRTADGERYFLKLRLGSTDPVAVLVPQLLRERGLHQAVAALVTAAGDPWFRVGEYQLLLCPFVTGTTAGTAGLTDDQWREFGGFLHGLHGVVLPTELSALVCVETFVCPEAAGVRSLAVHIRQQPCSEPVQRELADFWLDREDEIADLADRVERLGEAVRGLPLSRVLCHADIHGGNILVDGPAGLSVVDWDAPIIAPPERDLMFVVGTRMADQPITASQQALFAEGYGPVDVNWPALAYYRYQRVVEDIFEFARSVLLRDDIGEEAKRDEFWWFRQQFAPGDAVDIARSSDRHLDFRW